MLGVVSAEQAREQSIPIVAPAGFLEEGTSENVLVGTAMAKRAGYMHGKHLPRNAQGMVDNGLGKAVAFGSIGLIPPTHVVTEPHEDIRWMDSSSCSTKSRGAKHRRNSLSICPSCAPTAAPSC